ncbi:MAG: Homeodomain-like domain, partial [Solirubrobacteraceae bacterium]|nr:Homeodomain-like domain [Solirubrobacteraceae bacterium]
MHPKAVIERPLALALEGRSATEIAARLGLPRSTVRDWTAGRVPRIGLDGEAPGRHAGFELRPELL